MKKTEVRRKEGERVSVGSEVGRTKVKVKRFSYIRERRSGNKVRQRRRTLQKRKEEKWRPVKSRRKSRTPGFRPRGPNPPGGGGPRDTKGTRRVVPDTSPTQ